MNVALDDKLFDDSKKIEIGLVALQNKLLYVINRHTDKNADHKATTAKYLSDLSDIMKDLKKFLREQKEFDSLVNQAAKEVKTVGHEIQKVAREHHIDIDGISV